MSGLCRHRASAAFAKYMLLVSALTADMRRHVFHYAEDGHFNLLEHLQALAGIQ